VKGREHLNRKKKRQSGLYDSGGGAWCRAKKTVGGPTFRPSLQHAIRWPDQVPSAGETVAVTVAIVDAVTVADIFSFYP